MKKILLTIALCVSPVVGFAAQTPITQIDKFNSSATKINDMREATNARLATAQSNFTELYTLLGGNPWLAQTTAPNVHNVFWIDTSGTSPTIKYWDGDSWEVAASGGDGTYTLPVASSETLGGIKVGDRLTMTDGVSHFWTKDLTIAYLTTGDMRYMDAINESLLHVSRVGASSTTTGVETRHQYRGIDALLHGYMVTGDVSKLSSAYSMFSENILVREGGNCTGTYLYAKDCTGDGVSGWLQSGSSVGSVWVNYDTIGVEPTVKLYKTLADAGMEVEAATVRGFILRWAGWIKDTVFGAYGFGVYSSGDTLYVPYSVSINVTGATGLSVNSTWDSAYAATYADVLYLAWELSGDSSFKNTAIAVWKDYQYYYTSGAVSQGSPVTSVDSPSNARALYQNYSSGDTKVPKIIDKPSYFIGEYLKTNYQGPGKRYRLRAVPIIVHDGL